MLTGDKIETAKCIAISSGLKSASEKFQVVQIEANSTSDNVKSILHSMEAEIGNSILVIDGSRLEICTQYHEKLFFDIASKAKGVVCCRCSPTQKAYIVKKMRLFTKRVCAAIGDGGNDVSMITEANIGIGIVGKEGK